MMALLYLLLLIFALCGEKVKAKGYFHLVPKEDFFGNFSLPAMAFATGYRHMHHDDIHKMKEEFLKEVKAHENESIWNQVRHHRHWHLQKGSCFIRTANVPLWPNFVDNEHFALKLFYCE